MLTADTRQEFAPPHTPGMLRALVLALLAHAALVGVLAIGVAWKRELPPATVEAELWSAIPQEAAPPPLEETPPEPETAPQPEVKPLPEPPAPPPPVVKQAVPEAPSKADIALAKEKERLLEEQKAKELQAKQELERKALEKRKLEQAAKDKLDKERAAQAKLKEQQEKDKLAKDKAAREAKEKADRAEKARKAEAADKAKAAEAAKQKAEKAAKEEAKRAELERQQQLNRLAGLAVAAGSGSASSSGTAAKSSGPGANYSGRIQAAVKPNITFTDTIVGNPKTEIEVTLASNGEILSKRITKRSGNKAWDDAAENAIDKTRKLPLDDGKVWSPMIIVISPQTLVGQ
ncbi:cell envelope integrity protein TolA [Rhodoferax mekongensis]|uniref:Cell envelope integrity protein TolA n=1 Tax=Rhodoferax mekongensis TaxID=3068341 RepID=A0ABZ0AWR8_9BURK|nr:cell envelope integrity protein TolA [Rhodoferax sp. TBRC 17307]WNO04087.1 cell envelope integrity protein TolA [Rhodoferax sp. TBRC 17307]